MKGTMRVIDSTGDTKLEWDTAKKASVKEVREAFGRFHDAGHTAYAFKGDGTGAVITEFDQTATKIILAPRMAGG